MEMRGMSADSTHDNRSAIDAWNSASDHLNDFGDEGDWSHRLLLNPALFALLGEVAGRSILDLGCGEGYLSRMLARRGALVTGVEPAERLYTLCRAREERDPLGIMYHQQDASVLTLPTEAFDVVVMNMILQDIPDYRSAIGRAAAVLRSGGDALISILHPCFEESASRWPDRNIVEIREYFAEFARPQELFGMLYHRPLSAYINALLDEGLALQRMVEPCLPPEIAASGNYRDAHVPSFLVLRLRKLA
jgi:2-polyprenyl-3-methyl-5-hydroxy-6-metoxy-1,4-benzoquinol methylase